MNQIERCDWLAEPGLPVVSREKNFPLSQIINPLLAKVFGEDDYVLASFFFFLRVYGPPSRSINTPKKNSANIQPSLPHAGPLTHIYISLYRVIELYFDYCRPVWVGLYNELVDEITKTTKSHH